MHGGTVKVDLQMPAERGETLGERDHLFRIRAFAQVLHEVETHAAKALRVETFELCVRHIHRREGDANVVAVFGGDGVGHHAVIEPVAGGLDDDAALDADVCVHREQFFFGRIGRDEGGAGVIGKARRRAEHMHVCIDTAGRQRDVRFGGGGEVGGLGHGVGLG